MRPSDTPRMPARRKLPLAALGLVLFGGTALVASEIAEGYRGPRTALGRTVITFDAPGVLTRRNRALSDAATRRTSYDCKRVLALGEIEIGRSCLLRAVTVAARAD